MKKPLKISLFVLGGLVGLLAVGLVVVILLPAKVRPASTEKVEATPERLARGKYVFENVAMCAYCHSEHEVRPGAPIRAGTEGGGRCLDKTFGYEPEICFPNITSSASGVAGWTDGELIRAIREGVAKDGRLLSPQMPYQQFRAMSDEDVRAVVAYMRSLPPVDRQVPPLPQEGLGYRLMMKLSAEPLNGPVSAPDPKDSVAYGKYLTTLAGCALCHGDTLAGGVEFLGPAGKEVSANLTPDGAGLPTGRSSAQFVSLFHAWASLGAAQVPTGAGQSVQMWMPWSELGGMTPTDLDAVYAFLKTVPRAQPEAH